MQIIKIKENKTMKNLTKRGKIIMLIGALALVCVTCLVTMYVMGVLPSQSRGQLFLSELQTDMHSKLTTSQSDDQDSTSF